MPLAVISTGSKRHTEVSERTVSDALDTMTVTLPLDGQPLFAVTVYVVVVCVGVTTGCGTFVCVNVGSVEVQVYVAVGSVILLRVILSPAHKLTSVGKPN